MQPTSRLYFCLLCYQKVLICSHCDRGHEYCSKVCSSEARKINMKASSRRYQETFKGKLAHALRQADYKARLKKVTHQGSEVPVSNVLLDLIENKSEEENNEQAIETPCCCFCGKEVSNFYRSSFIRHKDRKSHSFTSD